MSSSDWLYEARLRAPVRPRAEDDEDDVGDVDVVDVDGAHRSPVLREQPREARPYPPPRSPGPRRPSARTARRSASGSPLRAAHELRARFLRPALWVALAAFLGAVLGAGYGYVKPPDYQISGEMQVDASFDLTGADEVQADVQPQDVVTQQALINSQAVRQAARTRVGDAYGTCAASTSTDSSVIQVVATGASSPAAAATLTSCLDAYLELVAAQQKKIIQLRLQVYNQRAQAADGQLKALDAVVAATPSLQQATVVGQQAAERAAAVAERADDQNRVARLQAALSTLPVNVSRLSAEGVEPNPAGLVLWQWSAACALVCAGAAGLVILRLAERRRQ